MGFLTGYSYIGLFFILAVLFAGIIVLLPQVLTILGVIPKKPNPIKTSTYECGMEPVGQAWVQFNFRYYLFALLFVVFDIETVFLYPWAVAYGQLKLFGLVEMAIFIAILAIGLVYAWKKKALEWK